MEPLCGHAKRDLLSSLLESVYEGILKSGIEVKVWSEECLAKKCSSCMRRRYIFLIMILPDISGQNGMTVQDRCGQSNDLSPVLHFYLPMRASKRIVGCHWQIKCVLNLRRI